MRYLRPTLLLLPILLGACASPVEKARWIEVSTPHFQLLSGAGKRGTARLATRLELLHTVLERLGLAANLDARVPLRITVFRNADDYAAFQPAPKIDGYLLARADQNSIVLHAGDANAAADRALREYVQLVLRNDSGTQYPLWYGEGLAEFLSTVTLEGGRIVIGTIPPGRAQWVLYGSPFSLRRLMTVEDLSEWSRQSVNSFQAQSWALIHFFHVADRAGFPQRNKQLARYIALRNRGLGADAACKEAFETDFEGLEQEFMAYLYKGELPYLGTALPEREPSERIRSHALSERDQRLHLGDLALALGVAWRAEAVRWYRLALTADPASGRAHAHLAGLLADPHESDRHFARALAAAGGDPEVHRLHGEALLARAGAGDTADAETNRERARRAFRHSIELAPDQAAAYAGLGRSYLGDPAHGDPAEGPEALRIAHDRQPADRAVALDLALLEAQAGSHDEARRLLLRLPAASHGDPAAAAQRAVIETARLAAKLPAQSSLEQSHLATRLDIDSPKQREHVQGLAAWVEARGQGGRWEAGLHDVIIALDESPSTFRPCGSDLDGDGEVGRHQNLALLGARFLSSDPDDSILHAELLAARGLIRQLDPKTTRVGLVVFAQEASVMAPLDTPEATLARLDQYEIRPYPSLTNIAGALDSARELFFAHREVDRRRQRHILLLSDGEPTAPNPPQGRLEAFARAEELGELGIPIRTFALGDSSLDETDFYRGLAERSGGVFIAVEHPADVVSEVANVRFTGLADVTLHSAPADKPGRAMRVLPNGAFDGWVPLQEGENLITITAIIEGGETLVAKRTVFYERPQRPGRDDEAQARELRERLQNRVVELELLKDIRTRPIQLRRLEMAVDATDEQTQGSGPAAAGE